jgi:hypothetical protein
VIRRLVEGKSAARSNSTLIKCALLVKMPYVPIAPHPPDALQARGDRGRSALPREGYFGRCLET